MIDGIGVQCHYFELKNASVTTIQNNLNNLAATGLPIYISEFEINLADDDEQLQEMSRLFPVLWEHPGVKGITGWGYIQGQMWKINGYLVRSDGSERPALEWLRYYLDQTDVKKSLNPIPADYTLHQNYPNPFNPTTTIRYTLHKSTRVEITIYNTMGVKVKTLMNLFQNKGEYSVFWDGNDDQNNPVSSGIYFYYLIANNFRQQRKMLLVR